MYYFFNINAFAIFSAWDSTLQVLLLNIEGVHENVASTVCCQLVFHIKFSGKTRQNIRPSNAVVLLPNIVAFAKWLFFCLLLLLTASVCECGQKREAETSQFVICQQWRWFQAMQSYTNSNICGYVYCDYVLLMFHDISCLVLAISLSVCLSVCASVRLWLFSGTGNLTTAPKHFAYLYISVGWLLEFAHIHELHEYLLKFIHAFQLIT